METVMKWMLGLFIVVGFVAFLKVGSVWASSLAPPSPKERTLEGAIERFGQAPWIFLGAVQSVDLVPDPASPLSIFPRWQAQHTRFRVIQGIKGPFHEGYEVELKECAPRPTPGHSLCGTLYPRAPDSKIGTIFLIVTGPGNPNVHGYQTSIRLPATRVPVLLKPAPIPGELPLEEITEDGFARMPWSESGWLIDFSRFTPDQEKKLPKEEAGSAARDVPSSAKGKASGAPDKKESLPLAHSGVMDLNQFTKQLGKPGK